jgi:cob(I)alamin adenosyltransferase
VKLYTRKGDDGFTALFGGQHVRKDDPRVCAYGTVDELCAVLGWAAAGCTDETLAQHLKHVQADLFRVGAELASPAAQGATGPKVPVIHAEQIERIERWIDEACAVVPEIKTFILPGGCEAACRLHIARAVCRRAERLIVDLVVSAGVRGEVLAYLNRLGDVLFAWARWANYLGGVKDEAWTRETP